MRLLLMTCSKVKRSGGEPLDRTDQPHMPAWDRYDGVFYRLVKKFHREGGELPTIRILSARYGLIDPAHPVVDYDDVMNKATSTTWMECRAWADEVRELAAHSTSVFIQGGEWYQRVWDHWMLNGVWRESFRKINVAEGEIGEQMSQMKKWLWEVETQPWLPGLYPRLVLHRDGCFRVSARELQKR